jgi:hypothetical protein
MAPRLTEIVASAAVVSGITASSLHAQSLFAPEVLTSATELVAALEAPGGCDLSIHGEPRFDETTERWLIAYSGVGPDCDDTKCGPAARRAVSWARVLSQTQLHRGQGVDGRHANVAAQGLRLPARIQR